MNKVALPTLVGGFLSTACTGDLSALDPAGPAARAISSIWWVMLAGSTAILLLVCGLIAFAFLKRRPASPAKRVWIVGAGLVFPITVLTALLAYGLVIGERLLPRQSSDLVRVSAESSQWRWVFGYDGGGRRTYDALHIPAGRPVDVVLTTADVIHAFWVPRLGGKMDAVPGRQNVLRIEADRPGIYAGVCAEYCGIGHARHGFRVVAHDAAGWQAFSAGDRP
ncbi:cytochrome c oxidase subunit II [Pacificimonas flava]